MPPSGPGPGDRSPHSAGWPTTSSARTPEEPGGGSATTPSAGDDPVRVLPDGTVKQVNPLSGTQVWTVPGRGNRPLRAAALPMEPLAPGLHDSHCAFCPRRYRETPPEKARLVRDDTGWRRLSRVPARELDRTVAEFRRVPNLFEILSLDYWRLNHGYRVPPDLTAWMEAYLADPDGYSHAAAVARAKALASGLDNAAWAALDVAERRRWMESFFAGGHDVVIARRHYVDGAVRQDQLASSGTLTPEEHAAYVAFTVEAMVDLYARFSQARYVATFQNWLRPAGASFDHLHKQLVAIDEIGSWGHREVAHLERSPDAFNREVLDVAVEHGLILAENEHAVAFAGFGHRYPTVEVFSTAAAGTPWEHGPDELRAVSDLLHACHAAVGATVACNEEWYHRPRGVDVAMPWHVSIKLRISTLAGFEGSTKINVNTVSPHQLRDRLLPRLRELRDAGTVAAAALGEECTTARGRLHYLASASTRSSTSHARRSSRS